MEWRDSSSKSLFINLQEKSRGEEGGTPDKSQPLSPIRPNQGCEEKWKGQGKGQTAVEQHWSYNTLLEYLCNSAHPSAPPSLRAMSKNGWAKKPAERITEQRNYHGSSVPYSCSTRPLKSGECRNSIPQTPMSGRSSHESLSCWMSDSIFWIWFTLFTQWVNVGGWGVFSLLLYYYVRHWWGAVQEKIYRP